VTDNAVTSGAAAETTPAEPDTDYVWLVETSDDGNTWWEESHPVHGMRDSGGIELSATAEEMAQRVLDRRFAALHGDTRYDWEELWFRVIVWDHYRIANPAGWAEPPHRFEQGGGSAQNYGRYLQANHAEPDAVEVRTPRQARNAVWRATATRP
jgi:hypothetical protein